MAGQLTIDTLKASSGVFGTQNAISGIAQAWVYFNGVSGTSIGASFNVSSVTRNGTGDYTINFTTALADANYAIGGSASRNTATTSIAFVGPSTSTTKTASACEVLVNNDAGALEDSARCSVIIHR